MLFLVTLGVIALIVVMLLGWIDHLSTLGRVGETTDRVEQATLEAIRARVDNPYLGGRPLREPERDVPGRARPVCATAVGYVKHVDVGALSALAERCDAEVFVTVLPGTFVDPSRALAWMHPFDGER